jgi:hypothetical protein
MEVQPSKYPGEGEMEIEVDPGSNLARNGTVKFSILGTPPPRAGQLFVGVVGRDNRNKKTPIKYVREGRSWETLPLAGEALEYHAHLYYLEDSPSREGRVVLAETDFDVHEAVQLPA